MHISKNFMTNLHIFKITRTKYTWTKVKRVCFSMPTVQIAKIREKLTVTCMQICSPCLADLFTFLPNQSAL